MKISYISKTDTWNDKQIINEANKKKIYLEKIDINNLNDSRIYDLLGDVIFWRSSSLNKESGRATFLNILDKKGKIIINRSIIEYPSIIYKQFQQEHIKINSKTINTIPTFTFLDKNDLFEAINKNKLVFPFIKKPNLGSKGEGIKLIKKIDDIDLLNEREISESVFQNFIKNNGDYRVLVIGGKPIEVIKRVGEKESFLNNVSMGGETLLVEDKNMRVKLFEIAAQVAALSNLGFCGIDIIQDEINGELYFLELNTVPQWEGFQKCTGINIAEKILQYCGSMLDRNNSKINNLVEDCYINYTDKLASKKFHFFTRMFLWTNDKKYLKKLNDLKNEYYGEDNEDFKNIIQEILNNKNIYQKKVYNKKDFRLKVIDKYPLLGSYSEILFRNLMSKNIFNIDLKTTIGDFVNDCELLDVRKKLLDNYDDMLILSTFAINYIYFLEDYFDYQKGTKVNVEKLLKIAQLENFGKRKDDQQLLINDIYFITHIMIGASRFYKKKIIRDRNIYLKLFAILEKIIDENYIKLSLDTKLELLICANLLKIKSKLKFRINQEVEFSLSPINNFLVDTLNTQKNKSSKDWIGSEHRNVLYIMLNS